MGDYVRFSQLKTPFEKHYDQRWTGEIFKIARRERRERRPVYVLKDYNNEPVTGMFYLSELQKVEIDPECEWKIEKVLKTRRRGGHKEMLVKFLHWPRKFNSWIPATNVKDL